MVPEARNAQSSGRRRGPGRAGGKSGRIRATPPRRLSEACHRVGGATLGLRSVWPLAARSIGYNRARCGRATRAPYASPKEACFEANRRYRSRRFHHVLGDSRAVACVATRSCALDRAVRRASPGDFDGARQLHEGQRYRPGTILRPQRPLPWTYPSTWRPSIPASRCATTTFAAIISSTCRSTRPSRSSRRRSSPSAPAN